MAINITIIEDDPMFREELTDYFSHSDKIHCALVVDSIPKFQQFYRDFLDIRIVLLDINLPGISGDDGIPIIRRMLPNAEIVMHTVVNDYDTIFKCICLGANGYLVKNGKLEELENTILNIEENDGCALSPSVARRIISYFQPKGSAVQDNPLSDQELKIARLLVDGLSYLDIAAALGITINGVRYHVKNIYKKLHISSKGALLQSYRQGKIDL